MDNSDLSNNFAAPRHRRPLHMMGDLPHQLRAVEAVSIRLVMVFRLVFRLMIASRLQDAIA